MDLSSCEDAEKKPKGGVFRENASTIAPESDDSLASFGSCASASSGPCEFPSTFMESLKRNRLDDSEYFRSRAKLRRLESKSESDFSESLDQKPLKVCGPSSIHTLRGWLHGREVAMIFCGESHEDAIDLTRKKSIIEHEEGWLALPLETGSPGFDPLWAAARKEDVTLAAAKKWAENILDDEPADIKVDGAVLLFEAARSGLRTGSKGVAMVFLPGVERSVMHPLQQNVTIFEWGDLDYEARIFNRWRADPHRHVLPEEQDALIGNRKLQRFNDGFELFDDWLIRQSCSNVQVDLVLEAPVSAKEVELHVDAKAGPAPLAHERLRQIGPDSDEEEEADTGGNGSFLDYLRRRVSVYMPSDRVHCIDPRGLGDADDECLPQAMRGSFEDLRPTSQPMDEEEIALEVAGAEDAWVPKRNDSHPPLPSWEAFFGGAADLLYYAAHVKADYAPFLATCVGNATVLRRFFQALYFSTVPEALSEVRIDKETRTSACTRSLTLQRSPDGPLLRRPAGYCKSGRTTIPVRAAPVGMYLKARGSTPPRTWVSAVAERLRLAGAEKLVNVTRAWYQKSVDALLADPKAGDVEGDNFAAWLRAVHPEIYSDIDTHDPKKLKRQQWATSRKNKENRYNLRSIQIPNVDVAFGEFTGSKALNRLSTPREMVLSKIIVDSFQLRLVDLAIVLKAAEIAMSVPAGGRAVIVIYAGLDHTRNAMKFWRSQGFHNGGLPRSGEVGQENYDEDESRSLTLPPYLHDFDKLFPVPPAPVLRGARSRG